MGSGLKKWTTKSVSDPLFQLREDLDLERKITADVMAEVKSLPGKRGERKCPFLACSLSLLDSLSLSCI
jgi:hypothetical protein